MFKLKILLVVLLHGSHRVAPHLKTLENSESESLNKLKFYCIYTCRCYGLAIRVKYFTAAQLISTFHALLN